MTRRVLVVDDEEDIRAVARLALERVAGWQVRTVAGGEEALEAVAAERPDAVLLDVQMPDVDGPTTVARLRERFPDQRVPVLLLTAEVQGGERRHLAGLDVDGVIAKPFDPLTLGAAVEQALGWGPA